MRQTAYCPYQKRGSSAISAGNPPSPKSTSPESSPKQRERTRKVMLAENASPKHGLSLEDGRPASPASSASGT